MKFQKSVLIVLFCCYALLSFSQKGKEAKPLTRVADFEIIAKGNNTFQFRSGAANLEVVPTAGATRPPSFGHYWEFGDGHFSFEENPTHTYSDVPDGDAVLYLTNNYDNGELPTEKPKRPSGVVAFNGTDVQSFDTYLPEDTLLLLRNNHDPKPNERMVCVISYKNPLPLPAKGKLYLFFNETAYSETHFELAAARTHFGEIRDQNVNPENLWSAAGSVLASDYLATIDHDNVLNPVIEIQSLSYSDQVIQVLENAKKQYRDVVAWDSGLMEEGEIRNLFTTLNTTAAMLKDTTATVTITSLFVPEGGDSYTESVLEMAVVAAHDPNKISVSKTRANFRRIADKPISYTIHFQNTAEGSADSITIDCSIPAGLDIHSIQIKKTHLKKACLPCEKIKIQGQSCISQEVINEGLVRFVFHHIQLPGKNDAQDNKDTKGYLQYEIKPAKKIKKFPLKSRADIFFDKEEAVVTNFSSTRFKPGLSIGLKGGFNNFTQNGATDYYFGGITVSPFKSYKKYLQAEILLGRWRYDNQTINSDLIIVDNPNGTLDKVNVDTIKNIWTEYYTLDLVPLQLRKNLTDFLAVGLGTQLSARMGKLTHKTRIVQTDQEGNPYAETILLPMTTTKELQMIPSLFADLSVGLVRVGPSVGLRYLYSLSENAGNAVQVYLLWKI